jgi:hypothetical protein
LQQIQHLGETDHEPACLAEGLRRVLDREVELHFHRVVAVSACVRRRPAESVAAEDSTRDPGFSDFTVSQRGRCG